VVVLASLVLLTRQDHERWEIPARSINILYCGNPVSVAWLYDSSATYYICACDNLRRCCNAHHKASLIKVVYVIIKYAVHLARLLNELEPRCNCNRILAASALAVKLPISLF
jgi:hypothetical protein